MEKELARGNFSVSSRGLIDPRRVKKGSLFKRNARANIIFARLINDRRAYQRDHLAATKFNQAFHYARHSERPFDRWRPNTSKVMRSMNRYGRIALSVLNANSNWME